MSVISVIVIIILVISLLLVGAAIGFTEYQVAKERHSGTIYPFSGSLDPLNPKKPISFVTKSGRSQISCPKGFHVNIIGATVEVSDPMGECSTTPNDLFQHTCGKVDDTSGAVACSSDGQCATGLTCQLNVCVPKTCTPTSLGGCGGQDSPACPVNPGTPCSTNADCKGSPMVCATDGSGKGQCLVNPSLGSCMGCLDGKCAQFPLCNNVNKNYNNTMCAPDNNTSLCRPRDASAYLAKLCDGKQECDLSEQTVGLDPSIFGPLPCRITPGSGSYAMLPVVPGYNGINPPDPKTGKNHAGSFNQGYYVHGIYTCIPDSE